MLLKNKHIGQYKNSKKAVLNVSEDGDPERSWWNQVHLMAAAH